MYVPTLETISQSVRWAGSDYKIPDASDIPFWIIHDGRHLNNSQLYMVPSSWEEYTNPYLCKHKVQYNGQDKQKTEQLIEQHIETQTKGIGIA